MGKGIFSIFKGELARSSALIISATLAANIIMFLANLFFSERLGPESFGIFKTILYLSTFLPILIDFGINISLTKYIAEFGRNRERIGHLVKWFLKVKIISYLILVVVVFLLKDYIALLFLKDASLSYLIISGALFILFSFFSFFEFVTLGYQRFKLFALSQFLGPIISSIVAILLTPLGIFYMVIGWSFGPLIGNIFNVKFFFDKNTIKTSKEFDIKRIFWKFSLPMYLINIPVALISAIVPILSLFFPANLIGYYSFAFIFYSATLLIPTAISNVLFPKVSKLNGLKRYVDAKNILKKVLTLYSFVTLIGLVFVFFASDWLFLSFFKDYLPGLLIFKVLFFLGLVFGYNTIYVNYLKGLGRVKRFAIFVLVQNILLIVISFALLTSM